MRAVTNLGGGVQGYRSYWLGGLVGLTVVGLAFYLARDPIARYLAPWDSRPSYVLIVLDDLDWDLMSPDWLGAAVEREAGMASSAMAAPTRAGGLAGAGAVSEAGVDEPDGGVRFPVLREMARQGLVFTNFHSTTPVCGPARACVLSGQYAGRHGVRVNRPNHPTSNGFSGGVQSYGRERDLSTWCQRSGYETGFVGKYVHDGFSPDPSKGVGWADLLPLGWDHFHASLGASYSDFWVIDRSLMQTSAVRGRYRTTYEADVVIEQLAKRERSQQAQLICWFPLTPHDSADGTQSFPLELTESFGGEQPPAWSRQTGAAGLDLPPTLRRALPAALSREQRVGIVEVWRQRLRSIAAFDRELGRIRAALQAAGRLDNTVFVITSDHGYRLGDHGHVGKRLPYDRITRVPLLISGPGVRAGVCKDLLGNVDLAPTLLDLMGGLSAEVLPRFDGRSFARCLKAAEGTYQPVREELLLQSWEAENVWGQRIPSVWTILRTQQQVYTEWADGQREFYDLSRDPEQLDNRYDGLTATEVEGWRGRLLAQAGALDFPPQLSVPSEDWDRLLKFPQNPAFQPIEVHGYVEAGGGIEQVELTFRDRRTGRYWSGSDWSEEVAWLPARIDNAGGVLSRWAFAWQTGRTAWLEPETELDTGERRRATAPERRRWFMELDVTVRAVDRRGASCGWESPAPLRIRPFDPETWLDEPNLAEWAGSEPLELTGRAIGRDAIQHVRVVVQDKLTRLYWNGEAWIDELAQNEAQLLPLEDGTTRWSYRFVGRRPDQFYLAARAMDGQNYFDHSVANFEFKLNVSDSRDGEAAGEAESGRESAGQSTTRPMPAGGVGVGVESKAADTSR